MQGQMNVGGSWNHAAKTIFVKVTSGGSSSWRNVTSGWVKVGGAWKKWFLSTFIDSFQRTTSSTSLGSPDGINTWSNIRGAWGIVNNLATANSSPSQYPMATIIFGSSDATIVQDNVTNGVGAAFWVTDANNWWATATDETQTYQTAYVPGSTNYGTCYAAGNANYGTCYVGGNPNYGSCSVPGNPNYTTCYYSNTNYVYTCYSPSAVYGTCYNAAYNYATYGGGSYLYNVHVNSNPYSCVLYYTQYCYAYPSTTYYPYSCVNGSNSYTYTCVTGSNSYSYTCATGSNSYSYTCATGGNSAYTYTYNYQYTYTVNLLKSIASTISTVATFSFSSLVVGLKTIVQGSTGAITVRGYSSPGFANQIGSDQTYTATGYTATTNHGMILAPATYNQGTTFSSYEVDFITI